MSNLLLVTRGTGGDLIPFLGMGSKLKARGHHVTLLTHCHYADVVKQAGLDFVALDTLEEFERFIEDGLLLNSPSGLDTFFQRHVLPKVISEYELIRERCHSGDVALVARHMSDIAARMVAEKLDIPIVRVFTAVAHVTTIPILEALCHRLLATDINQLRIRLSLAPVRDWHAWLQYPSYSVATWPDWFAAPDPSWPPGVALVGFVNHDETETGDIPEIVREILNGSKPSILITGGMGTFPGSEFYAASVEACRLLDRPGILVTRYPELIPGHLPSGVRWFKYLPFASLMPHVGVVIHHAGTSTLARALVAGVPQLVLPVGGDRPDTAARLQRLGVAEFLLPPQWQPCRIAEAVERLEASSTVQERCKSLANQLREMDSAAIVCQAIERCIANKGAVPDCALASETASDNIPTIADKQVSTADDPLDVMNLSPERRALLTLRLKKASKELSQKDKAGFANDTDLERDPNNGRCALERVGNLSPERRALLARCLEGKGCAAGFTRPGSVGRQP